MLVPDITIEVSLPNEVFNLAFEVMVFFGVMSVLPMEVTVSSLIPPFRARLDRIRGLEEPLLSDLEENLYPGRIKGNCWWPCSNSSTSWLNDVIEDGLSRLYHIRAEPLRVVRKAQQISTSEVLLEGHLSPEGCNVLCRVRATVVRLERG
ncbi:hypothetical protein BHM03_00035270 [Ensete ventricosum]|nr:hypothetical protein BHM03_00035270 [Ensete ventricosum]